MVRWVILCGYAYEVHFLFFYTFLSQASLLCNYKKGTEKMHFPIDKQCFDLSSHGRFALFLAVVVVFTTAVFCHEQGGTVCFFMREWGDTMHFFVFCGVWLLAPACGFFPPCLTRVHPFSIILAFTSILNGISWKRVTTDIFLLFFKKVAS